MCTHFLKPIIGIFLYVYVASAYERACDSIFGRPRYEDCMTAARRIPATFNPVFIGPQQGIPGTIVTPFKISNGNCEIVVQSSARCRTKWLVVQNLAAIIANGVPGQGPLMESGCVKHLGWGGVATARFANDPLWVVIKEKGVPGPPEPRDRAPLLKGVGPALRFVPPDTPLPSGWFPPGDPSSAQGASSSSQGQTADIEEVDQNASTS